MIESYYHSARKTNENIPTHKIKTTFLSSRMTSKKILNGIVGDYLESSGNELATKMALYRADGILVEDLSTVKKQRLCILVHGLVADENIWLNDTNFGQSLQKDLRLAPLYLRYNSGLHVSTNGRRLDQLLRRLLTSSSSLKEIIFLCHSMGGLVVRSACSYGLEQDAAWTKLVSHVVFLGTPHQGSYWEKAGNVVAYALNSIPRPYMKLAAQVGNLRSAGIKDLRYGYVRDEDWNQGDPDALLTNTKTKAELLDWASYHVVTGSITENPNDFISHLFGDALVHKLSAQGQSEIEAHHLPFQDFFEVPGVNHNMLINDSTVYEKIKEWIAQSEFPEMQAVMDFEDAEEAKEDLIHPTRSSGKYDNWKGGTSLVQNTIGAGVMAVGDVQRELTGEVYSVLSKWQLIAPVVGTIQMVHEASVDVVYASILAVNGATGAAARFAIDEVEKRQEESTTLPDA